MSLCKCGCGSFVNENNNYIRGHNRRGLASFTKKGKWSVKYNNCVKCNTANYQYQGKGLCERCYSKSFYNNRKNGKFGRWSKDSDCCMECGRIDRPHAAHGLCGTCHVNNLNRKKGIAKRNIGGWSWYYDKCQECGTTERPHVRKGLCYDCYESSKRDLTNYDECPVCHAKVNRLNQHLAMRAKKCENHKEYQHNRLKMYFDSDLNLSDIGKELEMERHSITRQFVKYFGKEKTKRRNELVRRCNISEKAVVNHNYKNMYGTIVEYDSPNQGKIKLRSKLEAKYAKELDDAGIDWFYERDSFRYIDKTGKIRTYTPDFYLTVQDKYIEIKGRDLLDDDDVYKIGWLNKNTDINIEVKIMN